MEKQYGVINEIGSMDSGFYPINESKEPPKKEDKKSKDEKKKN